MGILFANLLFHKPNLSLVDADMHLKFSLMALSQKATLQLLQLLTPVPVNDPTWCRGEMCFVVSHGQLRSCSAGGSPLGGQHVFLARS